MQQKLKLIILSFILFIIFSTWMLYHPYIKEKYEEYVVQKPRNIFFDLGANIGDSTENFLGLIDKADGNNDIKNVVSIERLKEKWILYLFEGNSKFDNNLINIKNKYSNDKHEILLFNSTIITDYDGYIDFWISGNTLGSSM